MRRCISILWLLILSSLLVTCDQQQEKRKIKLSDQFATKDLSQQLTTTIRLEPKERRTIAVLFFQNLTGDQNLEWLKKGVTEMLIRALSQSSNLSILSTDRLIEILDRVGATKTSQDIDLDLAALVGREANVEAVLIGQIKKKGGVFSINVKLQEPSQGFVLREESVEGKGIDAIFSMVDELTSKVKNDLQLAFEKAEAIRGISDITTNNLDAWREFSIGKDLVDKYLSNDAVVHFEKAVELDSSFAAAILRLYPMYLKAGNSDKAQQLFQKLMEIKPNCTKKEQFEIELLAASVNNDDLKFLETLEQWLQQFPEDRDAYMRMADVYRSWNNQEAEIKNLENILEIDPKYKIAYNRLGYAYANLGDFDKAVAAIEQYIKLAPDEVNPYDSAGEIYFQFGEYDKAEQYFKRALAINDSFVHSINRLGQLNLSKGNYKKALKLYHNYHDLTTNSWERAEACFMIGNSHLLLNNKTDAWQNYEKTLLENPYHFQCFDLIADTYTSPDDSIRVNNLLEKSYQYFQAKLNSETDRTRALFSLAYLSIIHNIKKTESTEILNAAIKELEKRSSPSVVLHLTDLKFLLTLLYGATEQFDLIDPLWFNQDIIPDEFWRFIKDAHSNSYSGNWKTFGLLNDIFYHELGRGFEFYSELIDLANKNQAQSFEMMFRLLLADLYKFGNDTERLKEQLAVAGVPFEKTWMVIGPFEYHDGFRKKYPPEKKIALNKIYKEKSGQVRWQQANDNREDGFINFRAIFQNSTWKVGYGLIFIESPDEREVQFRFGADDASKIWLNDQEIWKLNRTGDAIFDAHKRTVKLNQGRNKVLIKVTNVIGDWGFFFRVTDENGLGFEDLRFVAADE